MYKIRVINISIQFIGCYHLFIQARQASAPAAMRGQGRPGSGVYRAQSNPTITRTEEQRSNGLMVASSRMVSHFRSLF